MEEWIKARDTVVTGTMGKGFKTETLTVKESE